MQFIHNYQINISFDHVPCIMNKLCTELVCFCFECIPPIYNTEKPRNALNRARWSSTGASSLLLLCAFASCHWRAISFHFVSSKMPSFGSNHLDVYAEIILQKCSALCVSCNWLHCHNPCGIPSSTLCWQTEHLQHLLDLTHLPALIPRCILSSHIGFAHVHHAAYS